MPLTTCQLTWRFASDLLFTKELGSKESNRQTGLCKMQLSTRALVYITCAHLFKETRYASICVFVVVVVVVVVAVSAWWLAFVVCCLLSPFLVVFSVVAGFVVAVVLLLM